MIFHARVHRDGAVGHADGVRDHNDRGVGLQPAHTADIVSNGALPSSASTTASTPLRPSIVCAPRTSNPSSRAKRGHVRVVEADEEHGHRSPSMSPFPLPVVGAEGSAAHHRTWHRRTSATTGRATAHNLTIGNDTRSAVAASDPGYAGRHMVDPAPSAAGRITRLLVVDLSIARAAVRLRRHRGRRAVGAAAGRRDRAGLQAQAVPSGSTAPPPGKCSDHPCNYLLLGSDSRAGLPIDEQHQFGTNKDIGRTTRADTIMLVHTDPALQKAIVLSFPRDLWVDIPGHGSDKINAAFEGGLEGGGPQLMANTVANLTGLPIDHYLYVDLAGFQNVVDTLGGVDLCIPPYDVNTPGWLSQHTGLGRRREDLLRRAGPRGRPEHRVGRPPGVSAPRRVQALAYVRTRSLPCDAIPDFSRIGRQQQFPARGRSTRCCDPRNWRGRRPWCSPCSRTSIGIKGSYPGSSSTWLGSSAV